MTRVKICGVKRVEDALLAAQYGADAIGLLVGKVHASPDFIPAETAREIVRRLPPFLSSVLVTHVEELEELRQLLATLCVSTIQVHSELSPEGVATLRSEFPYLKILKSYHVTGEESLAYGDRYADVVDAFVLDSIDVATDRVGGTGKTHDWSLSARIVERYPTIPIVLAGGLNPENVAEAVARVKPFGVDVNSGTKAADGFKDPEKLKRFVAEAKRFTSNSRS